MKCVICKHGETKNLFKKANELVKNGTEVDIRKFQVAA
jgi:hypothetical protein